MNTIDKTSLSPAQLDHLSIDAVQQANSGYPELEDAQTIVGDALAASPQ